jgi:hypothetical protein
VQKRPNYWKYGFFLILLLSVISIGFLLFRVQETKNRVETSDQIADNANPVLDASDPTASSPYVSPTPSPSNIPQLHYSLQLPFDWGSDLPMNGVIHHKIGEIEGIMTYENSCLNYFGKRFTDDSREKKLDQWTQRIGERAWYVAHIDVPCLGKCNWNVYCVEGENKIFTMYLDNDLAQKNPDLIIETLSSFSFTN